MYSSAYLQKVNNKIKGKILVTGGTGSFGKRMVKRLLEEKEVEEIIVFSRDELKQFDMRTALGSSRLRFVIGDVRDRRALELAVRGVDTIFHAAALKQVPTGEFSPMELVQTNIIGTQNVLDMAERSPTVKKVVLLSTDKAVYPINAMGISKAMAERLVASRGHHETGTIFCAVRYGNVMATRGSVIPLFIDKIKNGQDITVTNPDMTRFLLSLEDAIELVLFAFIEGKQGDLFIRKAPASTIGDLAQGLVNLFKADNVIKVVGTRAGEKIHESLATQLELARAEDMGDYYRISGQSGKNPEDFFEIGSMEGFHDDYTSENTNRLDLKGVEKLLLSLEEVQNAIKSK